MAPSPAPPPSVPLYEAIVSNARDVVLVTSAEPLDAASGGPEVVFVNPAFTAMTGYEPEDIIGRTPRILQHPDTDRATLDRLGAALRRWQPVDVELLNRTKDGRPFWVELSITPVADEDGWFTHWIAVQREITVRKHRELELEALLAGATDLVAIVGADGLVAAASPSASSVLGIAPGAVLGADVRTLVHPDDAGLLGDALDGASSWPPAPTPTEVRLPPGGGDRRVRWLAVEVAADPTDPTSSRRVVSGRDVTEARRQRRELADAQERFERAFEDAPTAMAIVTVDGRIHQVNRALLDLVGAAPGSVPANLASFVHPDDEAVVAAHHARIEAGQVGTSALEARCVHRDGRVLHVLLSVSHLGRLRGGDRLIVHLVDVSERKALEDQLVHQALHDPLTGLPNRPLFADRLDAALRAATEDASDVAVVFVDLDRFKDVNDSLGHAGGDDVLRSVARRLRTEVPSGATVARFGGDEFAVLCEQSTGTVALELAGRLIDAVARPITVDGRHVVVTASAGVASMAGGGDGVRLLRDADAAMYHAKRHGRARVEVYGEALRVGDDLRLRFDEEFVRALAEDEIEVHYQPEVDLRTGATIGVEALVRWSHPEHGLLLPAAFIDLAERSGLIVDMGVRVMGIVCRDIARRAAEGDALPRVWINLSASQLEHPDFEATVDALFDATGVTAADIGFEVTESVTMTAFAHGSGVARRLRERSAALAIDDFGTEYSSLAALADLPVDCLKIDRRFVERLAPDATAAIAVVSAVIALGQALGLQVVAEGIERPDQLDVLRSLGCTAGQGFLLGRPAPLGATRVRSSWDGADAS